MILEIKNRGGEIDCFSRLMMARYTVYAQILSQQQGSDQEVHPVEQYLLSLGEGVVADEQRLSQLLKTSPRCSTGILNILLISGCSPHIVSGLVQRGTHPDALSWRLVQANPALQQALRPILPLR